MNPRNAGSIENPSAVGEVGNPTCGDVMKIYLKINDATRVIEDIKFEAITIENNLAWIDSDKCKACGMCVSECPTGAIHATEPVMVVVEKLKAKKEAEKKAAAEAAAAAKAEAEAAKAAATPIAQQEAAAAPEAPKSAEQ